MKVKMGKGSWGVAVVLALVFFSANADAFIGQFYDSDGYVYTFSINGGEGGFYSLNGNDGDFPATGTAVVYGHLVYIGFHVSAFVLDGDVPYSADYDVLGWIDLWTGQGIATFWNTYWDWGGVVDFAYGAPPATASEQRISKTHKNP